MTAGAIEPNGLTEDAFLGGKIVLQQPATGYRAGLDAVFLAAAAPCRADSPARVLDLGSGAGTVGLCVAARCLLAQITLVERNPILSEIAAANIAGNQLCSRAKVVNLGIEAAASELSSHGLLAESFDHVLANPPYHAEGRGTAAPDALKAASHAMPEPALDDWLRFMARMTKPGGTATMIHKADSLAAVLAAFGRRFGDLRVLPLHPREGQPATRILVEGIKGSRAPLVLLPAMILHGEGHEPTPQARAILRDAAPLVLRG